MELWIAQDEYGILTMHYHKPVLSTDSFGCKIWISDYIIYIDGWDYKCFKEVTLKNSPRQLQVTMTEEEKKIMYEPKPYALYENGTLKETYSSHKEAKAAKHYYKTLAYNDMLDLEYDIKPL